MRNVQLLLKLSDLILQVDVYCLQLLKLGGQVGNFKFLRVYERADVAEARLILLKHQQPLGQRLLCVAGFSLGNLQVLLELRDRRVLVFTELLERRDSLVGQHVQLEV